MSIPCIALRSAILTPGDAVRPIALKFAWTERHSHACKTPRSMYPSIYNSFTVIRTTIAKNRHFYVPRPSFFEKTIQCLPNPFAACTHLSWTVSQLFEPQVQKITVFTYRSPHFCFSKETPLRLSRNMLLGWKDNSMLAKPLAACTYLYSIVSELYDA